MFLFFFLMIRRPPSSTLFPSPPLSRSRRERPAARPRGPGRRGARGDRRRRPRPESQHGRDPGCLPPPPGRPELVARRHRALLLDRKSTRLNSSHPNISYAAFCLKKKNNHHPTTQGDPIFFAYLTTTHTSEEKDCSFPEYHCCLNLNAAR